MDTLFGEYFRQLRAMTGLSLRSFSEKYGFDAGNISRLERGVFLPPESDSKIREYARALGLREGGTEWIEFFDKAAASRGQLPHDLHSEVALLRSLPSLFRTIRGNKITPDALDGIIELVRASNSHGD